MLVLKVFVNYNQIDEVHIRNTGKAIDGVTQYNIDKPAKYDGITIYHIRDNGWKVLTEKVLYAINNLDRLEKLHARTGRETKAERKQEQHEAPEKD